MLVFQLTTSRRGRRQRNGRCIYLQVISTHYLTQRQTSTGKGREFIQGNFNSLPHAEVDEFSSGVPPDPEHFNSLPHAEVDRIYGRRCGYRKISTHYLTQRQTQQFCHYATSTYISTHYLTQRQTKIRCNHYHYQIIFQLTTSRRGRHEGKQLQDQGRAFQLTTSRRGRLCHSRSCRLSLISTHYLTQRQTAIGGDDENSFIFQLTTSRRGRHSSGLLRTQRKRLFQLTTSRRGRLQKPESWTTKYLFQLTTSRRGRLFGQMYEKGFLVFQLTTSRRGRHVYEARRRSCLHFNSLPHAEVDCCALFPQLHVFHFNSLPHAEVDFLHRCLHG